MEIWKFHIEGERATTPLGSKILSVGQQAGRLVVWALVDTLEPGFEEHVFNVVSTGDMRTPAELGEFLGTVQFPSGFVQHVFHKEVQK
jgi:hypothetical protein